VLFYVSQPVSIRPLNSSCLRLEKYEVALITFGDRLFRKAADHWKFTQLNNQSCKLSSLRIKFKHVQIRPMYSLSFDLFVHHRLCNFVLDRWCNFNLWLLIANVTMIVCSCDIYWKEHAAVIVTAAILTHVVVTHKSNWAVFIMDNVCQWQKALSNWIKWILLATECTDKPLCSFGMHTVCIHHSKLCLRTLVLEICHCHYLQYFMFYCWRIALLSMIKLHRHCHGVSG
jgi:hypothetical protein